MATCNQCGCAFPDNSARAMTFLPGELFCPDCDAHPSVETVMRERNNVAKRLHAVMRSLPASPEDLVRIMAEHEEMKAKLDRWHRRVVSSCSDASIKKALAIADVLDRKGKMDWADAVRGVAKGLADERECCESWIERYQNCEEKRHEQVKAAYMEGLVVGSVYSADDGRGDALWRDSQARRDL